MKFLIVLFIVFLPCFAWNQDDVRYYFMPVTAASYSDNPIDCLSKIHWICEGCRNITFSVYRQYNVKCDSLNGTCSAYIALGHYPNSDISSIYVVFRGIKNNYQFFENAWNYDEMVPFVAGGKVSKVFFDAFNNLWIDGGMRDDFYTLKNRYYNSNFYFFGHSIGGAMASLAVAISSMTGKGGKGLDITFITFGQPRTGDKDFADYVSNSLPSYRIVHKADIVPHLPPLNGTVYYHFSTELWYNNDMGVNDSFVGCNMEGEDPTCSNSLNSSAYNIQDHRYYYGREFSDFGINGCPGLEVKAEYQISIESADFCEKNIGFHKNTDGQGISVCKSVEFFDPEKKFFVNDETVIKFNGTLKFDRPLVTKISYPLSTKCIIKLADLEPLRTSPESIYQSKTMDIPSTPDIKYFYRIFQNHGNITFYYFLEFDSSDKKVETIMTIASGKWSKTVNNSYEKSLGYCDKICEIDDFFDSKNGYIVDGEVTINVEGILFVEKKDPDFESKVDGMGDTLLLEKNFEIIDKELIDVNKTLLAEVSPVFEGMLQSGMKESIENQMEITDFLLNTVDAAIKLINGISPKLNLDDMLPLLVFSDKYDIRIIKELIENHLISEILPSNVCQLIHFSNLFNASKLYGKSIEFFVKCYKDSVAVNDLDLLDKEFIMEILYENLPILGY